MAGWYHESDKVARHMAERSGAAWGALNDYPGYGKTRWREEARALLTKLSLEDAARELRAAAEDDRLG